MIVATRLETYNDERMATARLAQYMQQHKRAVLFKAPGVTVVPYGGPSAENLFKPPEPACWVIAVDL